jgi:hypothetical protein
MVNATHRQGKNHAECRALRIPPGAVAVPILPEPEVETHIGWTCAEGEHRSWCSDSEPEDFFSANADDTP